MPNLERYSTSGADLGAFETGPGPGETVDALLAAPNGDVYAVANTLGYGTPVRYNGSGTVSAEAKASPLYLPAGAALIGGVFFSGSTNASQTGVMAFDATTLAFLGNVLPIPQAGTPTVMDVASDGSRLYVVQSQGVTRFTVANGTTLTQDLSFQIPVAGHLRFKPGDQTIYLANAGRIDRFNATGQSQGTFIPAGTAGLTGITDFAFGNDGFLYVTGPISAGSELLKFDATTGAYIQQLGQFTGTPANSNMFGSLVVAQTPEPLGISLLPCLLLLMRPRRLPL